MNILNNIKQNWLTYSVILLIGLLAGYLLFGGADEHDHDEEAVAEEANGDEVWTCSMHPSVREDGPGSCPICGMDLIPADQVDDDDEDDYSMVMSESAVQLAQVQTVAAERRVPEKEMRLPGRIEVDERRITSVTSHFPGRIIDLKVNFTGSRIDQGEAMATVYSPELVSAQRELLQAIERGGEDSRSAESARSKLRQWELTDDQIREIEERGEVEKNMEILSPADGFVMTRNVAREDYVDEGSVLFEVADLDDVWVVMEAYEEDLDWIREGDDFKFASRSQPGVSHEGTVSYVDPHVDPNSRTVRVRADINNAGGELKPDMLVYSELKSESRDGEQVMVPRSSVLWSGPRSLVYVQDMEAESPRFEAREVELGHRAGDWYAINDGIEEGEEVVFHGAFRIDSEFQMQDRFSMMNREPGTGAVPGHDHGDMDDEEMEDEEMDEEHDHAEAVDGATDDFREDFKAFLEVYLDAKDALFESDFDQAQEYFSLMSDELESIGLHRMDGDAHMRWMDQYEAIEGHIEHILGADELEGQREGFNELSQVLIQAVQNYEISGVVYHQYCPMEDADWLNREEEIQNPYDPENMPTCGEVIERLEN